MAGPVLTPDAAFATAVAQSADRLLAQMQRRDIIRTALENRGALIEVVDLDKLLSVTV